MSKLVVAQRSSTSFLVHRRGARVNDARRRGDREKSPHSLGRDRRTKGASGPEKQPRFIIDSSYRLFQFRATFPRRYASCQRRGVLMDCSHSPKD
jgi:hypothetical protein